MNKKETTQEAGSGGSQLTIKPPNFGWAVFGIVGTAPLVINAFSKKARDQMHKTQEAGSTARGKKVRVAKDFKECFEQAKHKSRDGWEGFAASAVRAGSISACRVVDYKMSLAKLTIFVEADGFDAVDGTPLVRITKGESEYAEHYARNDNGSVDLRARPMYREGWEAKLRIRWDKDRFTLADVTNLLTRVGMQVGIGEGRADSKNSAGMGWGFFEVKTVTEMKAA